MSDNNYQVTDLKIDYVQGSEREVAAEWKFGDSNNKEPRLHLDKFAYAWWYWSILNNSGRWIEGESGDKTWNELSSRFTQSWTPPDNTTKIQFRIRPYATTYDKETGTGDKKKTEQVPHWQGKLTTVYFDYKKNEVPTKSVESIELTKQVTQDGLSIRAHWTWNTEKISPSNCEGWSYDFRKYKDNIWQDGQTGERTYTGPSEIFPVEAGVKKVKFNVKPIPKGSLFVGANTKWEEISIDPEPRKIDTGGCWLSYVEGTDKTYKLEWCMPGSTKGITGFECQYQYYIGDSNHGSWLPVNPSSTTIDISTGTEKWKTLKVQGSAAKTDWSSGHQEITPPTEVEIPKTMQLMVWAFTFEPDSAATNIRARVKPASTVDGTLYTEEWSTWVELTIAPQPRSVKDISIKFVPNTKSTLRAKWGINQTRFVSSFAYEWQYSTVTGIKNGNWLPGQNGSVDINAFSDIWSCIYSFPDDAKKARFRVKVVPTYEKAFTGEFCDWVNFEPKIPTVKTTGIVITVQDPATGMLRIKWDKKGAYTESGDVCEDEIDAYEYVIKYTLRSNPSSYIEAQNTTTKNTYVDYTPPENVSSVKISVKPNAKYTSEFEGIYGGAVVWDYSSIPTREFMKDSLVIRFQRLTNRTVEASWRIKDNNTTNVTGFDCVWRYSIQTLAQNKDAWRYPGKTETVDVSEAVDSGTRWVSTYDFPENAAYVFFKVKINPSSQLSFTSDYCEEIHLKWATDEVKVSGVVINPYDLNSRVVYATWNPASGNNIHVDTYECRWAYYYLGQYWYESVEAPTDSEHYISRYTVPEIASQVMVQIRPVPLYEYEFHGGWSNEATFSIITTPIYIQNETVDLRRLSDDNRRLIVSWGIASDLRPSSYDVEWDYTQNGVHFTQLNSIAGDATYLQDTFDSPEEAEKVWVRIRPVFDGDPTKDGQWTTEDFRYDWIYDTVEIENVNLSIQRGSSRTVLATWDVPAHAGLDSFEYVWRYMLDTGDSRRVFIDGNNGSTSAASPACTYDAPDNCTNVGFKVRAVPSSPTYFIGDYTSESVITIPADNTPEVPNVPTVAINGFTLTASLDTYDTKTGQIEFEIVDEVSVHEVGFADVYLNRASLKVGVAVGHAYRVRARGINDSGEYGEWSNYSSDVYTRPDMITDIIDVEATSATSVQITWVVPKGIYAGDDATTNTATIEKTTKARYFDTAPSQVSNEQVNYIRSSELMTAELIGLDASEDGYWYFRIKSTNSAGDSEWSEVVSIVLGTTPDAPTTWSSTMTATNDRDVYLYWVHNSEDGSTERSAELYLDVNGTTSTISIDKDTMDETTSYYLIPAGTYSVGAKIRWKVRTKGVIDEFGEWSITRQVEIYAPPAISMTFTSGVEGGVLTNFPLSFSVSASPASQTPIGYIVSIVSNSSYDGLDADGTSKRVITGETIFNKYYISSNRAQEFTLLPGDVSFVNTMSYTITVSVSMDSGLSASTSRSFSVSWGIQQYYLNAEISQYDDAVTALITPYCMDENFVLVSDVTLSVYRREIDGSFTLIMDEIPNDRATAVVDPHPSLDYARYRIVSRSTFTGIVDFYDMPPYPIGETAIVLQWDEEWSTFEGGSVEGRLVDRPYNGSFLKLPYNVKISDSNNVDSQLVEYIGRKHPVSYYGTQVGQKLSLSADIPITDTETLYLLRRLAIWMGDVYVREPSGSGYWSKVEVSFSQTRVETIIPVTINVTRVEGGV